ncbi:MAG: DUF2628 domain-containing protein [Ruminococcus sp.]|nr:DUF2628 domain-containing protein [Ruminococcus sp.]
MTNYTGSKCICCEKRFTDDDDIVVCPDCGTPYHRSCYEKNGRCINDILHDKNVSWLPDAPEPEIPVTSASNVKRCIRCGAENDPSLRYCEQCGTPLINMDAPRPFNDEADDRHNPAPDPMKTNIPGINMTPVMLTQDSDIDGVKLGDLARYVGPNPLGFLPSFIKFGKTDRKLSMNIFAFLFPPMYFMYRKMKGWGLAAALLLGLLNLPFMIESFSSGDYNITIKFAIDVKSHNFQLLKQITMYVSMILEIMAGFFANYLYYKQARRDIFKIYRESEDEDRDAISERIMRKGGTSYGYMLLSFMIYNIISIGSMLVVAKYF